MKSAKKTKTDPDESRNRSKSDKSDKNTPSADGRTDSNQQNKHEQSEDAAERETTKVRKKIFLNIWNKTLGSIKATCEKVGIHRDTYYDWLRNDPDFNAAVRKGWRMKLEDVEELMNIQMLKGDSAMIRYFLDRRHPLYNPRIKVDSYSSGEKTLEEEFDEMEFVDDEEIMQQAEDKYFGKAPQDSKQNPA